MKKITVLVIYIVMFITTVYAMNIFEAAEKGDYEEVIDEIEYINDRDEIKGETALHKSVRGLNPEILSLLLRNNADLNIRNNKGMTPLRLLVSDLVFNYKNIEKYQKKGLDRLVNAYLKKIRIKENMLKELIIAGAEIDIPSNSGKTALDLAEKYQMSEVKYMLQKGRKVLTQQNIIESKLQKAYNKRQYKTIGFYKRKYWLSATGECNNVQCNAVKCPKLKICKNGNHLYVYSSGSSFKGEITNGKFRNGHLKAAGEFNFEYTGSFKNDRPHGRGHLVKENVEEKGIFEKGSLRKGVRKTDYSGEIEKFKGTFNEHGNRYTGRLYRNNKLWLICKEGECRDSNYKKRKEAAIARREEAERKKAAREAAQNQGDNRCRLWRNTYSTGRQCGLDCARTHGYNQYRLNICLKLCVRCFR